MAPTAYGDFTHAAAPRRKQSRVPCEETLLRQWLRIMLGRIEHHLDHAFSVTVGWCEAADIDAEPARDR